jgi:hypothetical protein
MLERKGKERTKNEQKGKERKGRKAGKLCEPTVLQERCGDN